MIPNSKQNRQKIQNTEVKSILIKWVENADLNKPIINTVKTKYDLNVLKVSYFTMQYLF